MSGECERCSEHTLECICHRYVEHKNRISDILAAQGCHPMQNLASLVVERIKDIGFAQARLLEIAQDEIFDDLSKHNPWWESEHEAENDKLHDLRMKLSFISDKLWEIHHILDAKSDD